MDPKTTAAQLRCPTGQSGIEAAEKMNLTNRETNLSVFAELDVCAGDSILEIGPGNGGLVPSLLADTENVRYTGIDWSQEMVDEALQRNGKLQNVDFVRGSSDNLPFANAIFNKVFCVHTIYFWNRPETHLAEAARVLSPGGR
ncbi:MAG: class I SAM-dependent methyltransferase, partial [Planctomycetota bacterium]